MTRTGEAPAGAGRAGPYRLVRELGRRGMGTVYLAERDDAQFHQRVAVKIVRREMDRPELVQRFLAERQILATLSHPHIARLLDGGVTGDGRPYCVLEFVPGEPIDCWCEERRLSERDRLRLFAQVARAVHYAHRNLVVHRDLKPSNILATPDGHAKLVDFGIAKLLDPAARWATSRAPARRGSPSAR
ncbi:MAG TPA: serine/threonine-protein kinase [Gemmatimonadales bacterium]|nr:serine/threonine-protein kinase [Gemmatimonadales bacterium]